LSVALFAAAVISIVLPAQAAAPEGSPLVAGTVLKYRYAIYTQDLVEEELLDTQFGFMACELVPVHGLEKGAFRVQCEGGPANAALKWQPWNESGYYAFGEGGLQHITNDGKTRLSFPTKPEASRWTGRSILVLGEPVSAFCPLDTEPTSGQSMFEESCWTPAHGPVFFVGVDTSVGITEATWELLTVTRSDQPRSTAVSVTQAEKLVKGWLWTQNANRFGNYGWLYGAVFHGVERGVAGTGSFDRSNWLRKREPLFQRRNRVRIKGMKILPAGDTTVVIFEQHRTLGTRVDHGLRELRLSLERGRVVIAREEMLYALAQ